MASNITQPANLTNRAIGMYAERIASHFNLFEDGSRADIDELVAKLGGEVEWSDGPESLHVRQDGTFTIFIPLTTSSRRDRFTKAHELGHFFLHHLLPAVDGEGSFNRGSRSRAETEANIFASSLLMPAGLFSETWRELNGNERAVARKFDVSPVAAEVRAKVLGLK